MTWQTLLINVNAIACILISIRLLFFRKRDGRHRPGMAWLAYGLILGSAWVAFSIWHGNYVQLDYGELIMNVFVCVIVWRARGNVAKIAVSTPQ
jgi:hypothetical protein